MQINNEDFGHSWQLCALPRVSPAQGRGSAGRVRRYRSPGPCKARGRAPIDPCTPFGRSHPVQASDRVAFFSLSFLGRALMKT
jgi:hypothetical protein